MFLLIGTFVTEKCFACMRTGAVGFLIDGGLPLGLFSDFTSCTSELPLVDVEESLKLLSDPLSSESSTKSLQKYMNNFW